MGGRKDIFPVKSLNTESGPTPQLSALICNALMQALYAAEDYLTEVRVNDGGLESDILL